VEIRTSKKIASSKLPPLFCTALMNARSLATFAAGMARQTSAAFTAAAPRPSRRVLSDAPG
jgi:hypothetical protein